MFRKALKKALEELRVDIKKFSKVSGVSQSLLCFIRFSRVKEPTLVYLPYRKIIQAIKRLEDVEGGKEVEPFIAVIVARPALDTFGTRYIEVKNRRIKLKEYAAMSIEDVIVAAVRAQQEGAGAIVCAPIVSTTVEKVAKVPVSACPVVLCRQPLLKAAEIAASKVLLE